MTSLVGRQDSVDGNEYFPVREHTFALRVNAIRPRLHGCSFLFLSYKIFKSLNIRTSFRARQTASLTGFGAKFTDIMF